MTTRIVKNEARRAELIALIKERKLPFTATITIGKHRTEYQNRTAMMWCKEISEQLGDQTPEEIRGFNKLTMGVPILRAENEAFRIQYDAVVKPLTYEQKLAIMQNPLDLPVTRLFNVAQLTKYLDEIQSYWLPKGIVLTQPKERMGPRDD